MVGITLNCFTMRSHSMTEERVIFVQIAIEKTKGNLVKAIELLKTYVDTFMTDKEAWSELGDLYLQVFGSSP